MLRRAVFAVSCLCVWVVAARADSQFFLSNGVKIHYTVEGKGEPVVLIHGFSVTPEIQWGIPGIRRALAKNYKVISIDCRGHGQSGKPHDPQAYGAEMAEDVIRLLDHLKIKKAHLVGYSMGGFITMRVAATHPERVRSATTGGAGWSAKVDTGALDAIADSLDAGKGMGPLIERLTPPGRPKPSEEQMRSINQMVASLNDTKALAAVMRSMKGLAITEEQLKDDKVPTLAIVGDADTLKDGVDALKGRLPDLQVVVIKGADHMDAFLKPEFLNALTEFLARHSKARTPAAAGKPM
jgi:pimeloyl-ACP methyl ester carboxylesterase